MAEPDEDLVDEVVAWRYVQLQALGFDPDAALLLAGRKDVDVHRVADLVLSGCPPSTAVQILA